MTCFKYDETPQYSEEQALEALKRSDPNELRLVVIAVSLHHANRAFVERFCMNLARHPDEMVRGNAVLAFGHLARRFQELSEADVRPIIESALIDQSEYVRGQAWAAADDIVHFLDWKIIGFEDSSLL